MKRLLKYCCVLICIGCLSASAFAQPFSYIYIQGDKQTPFYVKVQGKMQPRYGKNYCILSELNAGPIDVEILFQQRIFPAQHFIIDVPDNGYRGFLLNRQADSFVLYDLQRKVNLTSTRKLKTDNK